MMLVRLTAHPPADPAHKAATGNMEALRLRGLLEAAQYELTQLRRRNLELNHELRRMCAAARNTTTTGGADA